MPELLGFTNSYASSSSGLGGSAIFFGMTFVLPAVFGHIITLGDWKTVGKSFLIWYGILIAFFSLGASRGSDVLFGALVYAMFFSLLAVPCLAGILKLWVWGKTLLRPKAPTP